MIKRTTYNLFIIILCSSLIMLLTSCAKKTSGDEGNFEYPDYPLTEDNGIPSWEQGDKEPIEKAQRQLGNLCQLHSR